MSHLSILEGGKAQQESSSLITLHTQTPDPTPPSPPPNTHLLGELVVLELQRAEGGIEARHRLFVGPLISDPELELGHVRHVGHPGGLGLLARRHGVPRRQVLEVHVTLLVVQGQHHRVLQRGAEADRDGRLQVGQREPRRARQLLQDTDMDTFDSQKTERWRADKRSTKVSRPAPRGLIILLSP